MKFDTNDLVYAYLTMQEADNDIAKFEYYCTMRRGVKNPFVAGCLFQ